VLNFSGPLAIAPPIVDWAELTISAATFTHEPAAADAFLLPDVPFVSVSVRKAPGEKCARCWRVLPEVGENPRHSALCRRCADAVESGLVCRAAAE